jgi:proteic killer suppression protein
MAPKATNRFFDQHIYRCPQPMSNRSSPQVSRRPKKGRIDRIPGFGIFKVVFGSFGDKQTEALFADDFVREFQGVARRAKRKLEALNAASRLEDLKVPPSNRLEKLRGDLKDFHSIRVNDQWRVIFKWRAGDAQEVQIVDYH